MHVIVLYIVVKFQPANSNTFRDMNYFLGFLVQSGQTESDAYEPTVQYAQVGSKIDFRFYFLFYSNLRQGKNISVGIRYL